MKAREEGEDEGKERRETVCVNKNSLINKKNKTKEGKQTDRQTVGQTEGQTLIV